MDKRVIYIDTIKGLCVMWIVWYHTTHPNFVNYPFFNITLFCISGTLYKPYQWNIFLKKKTNQLIIPFCFFYIIYYIFLLATNYFKYGSLGNIIYSITDIFKLYSGNEGFVVNYPLWFICAIICMQLIIYVVEKFIKNKIILLITAFLISYIGYYYLQWVPTYFMFGRSLPYFIYFTIGYLAKNILLSKNKLIIYKNKILFSSIGGIFIVRLIEPENYNFCFHLLFNIIEFTSVTFLLVYLCNYIQGTHFSHIITYFGMYSMIVLGLHDMYLTVFSIIIQNTLGEMNIIYGFLNLICTSLLLWPSIYLLTKYLPFFVAKKDVFKISHNT